MSQEDTKTTEPLDTLACRIEEHVQKSDDHLLMAAKLMAEARRRVEAGEAGQGVKWTVWARTHISLKESRLRQLKRIAEAKDPAKELDRQRKQGEERARKHRERKAAETRGLEPERKKLIDWAKEAPLGRVKQVWRQIDLAASNDNAAKPDANEPAAASDAA